MTGAPVPCHQRDRVRGRLLSMSGAVATALLVVACGSPLSELESRLDALPLPDAIMQVDEEVEPNGCGFGVRSCPNMHRWFTSEQAPEELCEALEKVVATWETETGEAAVRDLPHSDSSYCAVSVAQGGRMVHAVVYDLEGLAIYGDVDPDDSVRSALRVTAEGAGA